MAKEIAKTTGGHASPFERIKRTNDAGMEFWSSRDFSEALGYGDYRNFEGVIEKAKMACFNSGYRLEDHFVDVTDMIEIGKGGQRPVKTVLLSRYACYLVIQNADPNKEILAQGQTYFAIQTRRQELADESVEDSAKSHYAPFRTGKNGFFDNRLIFGDNLLALKDLEQGQS